MSNFTSKFNQLFLGSALAGALLSSGCGGGGGGVAPNPTVPGQQGENQNPAVLQGQVLVPEELGARTASLTAADLDGGIVSTRAFAGAIVSFTPTGQGQSLATAVTGPDGRFTLNLPTGSVMNGKLKATQGQKELEADVTPDFVQGTGASRNISVESTVAAKLKNQPGLASLSILELEEMARTGEARGVLSEVVTAFQENRPPVLNEAQLSQDASELEDLEVEIRKDCRDGRLWCVLTTRVKEVPGQANQFRVKLMLIRMDQTADNSIPKGSVGAGKINFRWPGTLKPTGAALSSQATKQFGENGFIFHQNPNGANGESSLSFIIRHKDGFSDRRINLMTLQLNGPAPNDETGKPDRATVTGTQLRGVLSEKRSASSGPNS